MAWETIPDDPEGFRRLFESQRDLVFRVLFRLARHADDAEDLLQDTFATLWRKRSQFRGEGSLEGYVRKIAYRTYLNARPRLLRARGTALLDDAAPAAEGTPDARVAHRLDQGALLERVKRAVDGLPDDWREPFVLFRYEGMSCREVAETMDLTPKAVEIRVARALKDVVRRLGVGRDEPGGRAEPSRAPNASANGAQNGAARGAHGTGGGGALPAAGTR
jgi:RNA polymerase sigma-70 factor (ECF subfamily)